MLKQRLIALLLTLSVLLSCLAGCKSASPDEEEALESGITFEYLVYDGICLAQTSDDLAVYQSLSEQIQTVVENQNNAMSVRELFYYKFDYEILTCWVNSGQSFERFFGADISELVDAFGLGASLIFSENGITHATTLSPPTEEPTGDEESTEIDWDSLLRKLVAKTVIGTSIILVSAILVPVTGGASIGCALMTITSTAVGMALSNSALSLTIATAQNIAKGECVQDALYHALPNAVDALGDGWVLGAITGSFYAMTHAVCFPEQTPILTQAGPVAIETIEVGDLVWATDPETGETELREVLQTFENQSNELVHLTIGDEVITTTPSHPFYVPQKGWTSAIDLRAGDRLVLLNGEYVTIEQVQHEILETPVTVYNFEVSEIHTYYVGTDGVLVHNTCRLAREAKLPVKGKMRYVPPKKLKGKLPTVKVGDDIGYVDRFGNIWVGGPSRTAGETFEWDVQLSRIGKEKVGHLTRDGKHLNVSLKGHVTH